MYMLAVLCWSYSYTHMYAWEFWWPQDWLLIPAYNETSNLDIPLLLGLAVYCVSSYSEAAFSVSFQLSPDRLKMLFTIQQWLLYNAQIAQLLYSIAKNDNN